MTCRPRQNLGLEVISGYRLASLSDGPEGDSRHARLHSARRNIALLDGAVHCLAFSQMSWFHTATASVVAAG